MSASTAGIAKEAGIANGSLFTYFETKTKLFNHLYLELKAEVASAALKGLPENAELESSSFIYGGTGWIGRQRIQRNGEHWRSLGYRM